MTDTTDTLTAAKNRASDFAKDARDEMVDEARTHATAARDHTVETAETAAQAAEAASDEFGAESIQAAALDQIGAQINSVAERLRDKPVDEMVDDVAVFARRNPLLFLGGAALVGFAAARFFKAGDGTRGASGATDDPWSGHLDTSEVRS